MRLTSESGVFAGLWIGRAGVYKGRVFMAYFGPGSYALARRLWCGKMFTDGDYVKRGLLISVFRGGCPG